MFSSIASKVKQAGSVAKSFGETVYHDLTAYPTEIACSNSECKMVIKISESVWDWKCSSGHVNKGMDEVCKQCQLTYKRPKVTSPNVVCSDCNTTTSVPTTNVGKHTKTAVKVTKKKAIATKQYAVERYIDWSSHPSKVPCNKDGCLTELVVPPEIWIWTCPDDHKNDVSIAACGECKQARPKEIKPRVVVCATCGTEIIVPGTNATVYISKAATKTKQAATSAKDVVVQTYDHLKSAPIQFDCSMCATPLVVPEPVAWTCQNKDCSKLNAAESLTCYQCKKKTNCASIVRSMQQCDRGSSI